MISHRLWWETFCIWKILKYLKKESLERGSFFLKKKSAQGARLFAAFACRLSLIY